MGYIKTIVQFINIQLGIGFLNQAKYANKWIIDIAQSLPRKKDGVIQLLPCTVDENGEAQYVGPDDDYDYIGYHRVNSITVGKSSINRGVGDGKGYDVNIIKMSYVVFARRDTLNLTNDEIALLIQASFPEAATSLLSQLQLKVCNISINDIILNYMQVFMEEFQGIEFFLKPEQFLLKVNYTIESAFDKKCFNTQFN